MQTLLAYIEAKSGPCSVEVNEMRPVIANS